MPLVIEAHGARYEIEDPGGLMGKALRAGNPYERKVLEHIQRQELRGLALDVGASVGNHSLWFAAVCGLSVIAVEPLDHHRLAENIALNPGLDITVMPIGLSDETTTGPVTGPPGHVVGEGFPGDEVSLMRLDEIPGLDDLVLVKIDVEGMEPEVLRGGEETIKRTRPLIFAEAIDDHAHFRVADILEPWGYSHTKTFGATPLEEWRP